LLQKTGCFKPRGITNRLLALSEAEKTRGLITVSGGNHGIAIARIGKRWGSPSPWSCQQGPRTLQARIRADGATLLLTEDAGAAFDLADKECAANGLTYIHSMTIP